MFGARKTQSTPAVQGASSNAGQQSMNNNQSRQPVGFETVLGMRSTMKGEFKSQANVRLDGNFEGSLDIDGNVLIGETARILADVHGKNITISGAIRGNVNGSKVQL